MQQVLQLLNCQQDLRLDGVCTFMDYYRENRQEPADDVHVVGHDIMAGGVVVAVRAPKC